MIIDGDGGFHRTTILDGKDISQAIRVRLVGAEEAEILLLSVACEDVAHHFAKLACRFSVLGRGLFDINSVVREGWDIQVDHQFATIGVRIGSHTQVPCRVQERQVRESGVHFHQTSSLVYSYASILRVSADDPDFALTSATGTW